METKKPFTLAEILNPILFAIGLIISQSIYIYSGWGIFILLPLALGIAFIVSIIYMVLFYLKRPPAVLVYTVLAGLVFGSISLGLNMGAATDGVGTVHIMTGLFGKPEAGFVTLFSYLTRASLLYLAITFVTGIIVVILRNLFVARLMAIGGVLLLGAHIIPVAVMPPASEAQIEEQKRIDTENLNRAFERQFGL